MRSDFYALPWAAQQAIRQGELQATQNRQRAFTVQQLKTENEGLRARIAELEADADPPQSVQENG